MRGIAGLTVMEGVLLDIMSDISEDCYCAGWLVDLDIHLWDLIEGNRNEFGMCHFDANDHRIMKLKELRSLTGSWPDVTGERCVPVAAWVATRGGRENAA